MKQIILITTLLTLSASLLNGCGNPKDEILGTDPLKQITEHSDKFKNIPEEERKLLLSYLAINAMGNLLSSNQNSVSGMTVGETIEKAKKLQIEINEKTELDRKIAKETEALKEQAIEERKKIIEKISSSIVFAVTDKKLFQKDYSQNRFNSFMMLKFAIKNKSTKSIKQLKGTLTFFDAVGDTVGNLYINNEKEIAPNITLTTTTGTRWEVHEGQNSEVERIATTELSLMTTYFEPEAIAFNDGEIIKTPQAD